MAEKFYEMLSDEKNATVFLIIIACYVLIITPLMVFYAIKQNSKEAVDVFDSVKKTDKNTAKAEAEAVMETVSTTVDDNQILDKEDEK